MSSHDHEVIYQGDLRFNGPHAGKTGTFQVLGVFWDCKMSGFYHDLQDKIQMFVQYRVVSRTSGGITDHESNLKTITCTTHMSLDSWSSIHCSMHFSHTTAKASHPFV